VIREVEEDGERRREEAEELEAKSRNVFLSIFIYKQK